MAKFIKKQNSRNYYEVNGYRAAGIIPYFKYRDKIFILVNNEYRSKKTQFHFLGGKVEESDKEIKETALREANEECGYLLNCIYNDLYNKLNEKNPYIKISKSKYISYLINIKNNNEKFWLNLPNIFENLFIKNKIKLKHNESLKLEWVEISTCDNKNFSYLGKVLIYKLKNYFNKDPIGDYSFI